MRTIRFQLTDCTFLHFLEAGFTCSIVFGLKASEFFVYFAPTGAEILSSEYTSPLRSLARAFLANPGAAHNSAIDGAKPRPVNHLRQGARLFPGLAAILGEYYGEGKSTPL